MDKVNLDPFAVEGRVTAQLFDARTGKQVDEQSGSNFLSRALTERLLRVAQRYAFAHQHPTQWDWCTWERFTHNADDQGFFRWIILTDSSLAESPSTEKVVPGTVIGYSNRQTHTDTDLRRGIINRSESIHRDNQTRWVMDWATDRGNGTIQSICWGYSNTELWLPDMLGTDATLEWVNGRTERVLSFYEGDYWLYEPGAGLVLRLAAATGVLLWSRTLSPTIGTGGFFSSALAVRGDFIFYVANDATLRRHTISTNTTSGSLAILASSVSSLVIIGDIVYIFDYGSVAHYHATGATLVIRRYSITGATFLTNLSIPNLPAGVVTLTPFPMSATVIRVGPGITSPFPAFYHDIDINLLTVTPLGVPVVNRSYTARDGRVKTWVPTQTTTYASTTMRPAQGMLFDVSSMAGNFLLSRIRLASPIIKDSTKTLKVIYDFNYL